MTEEGRPPHAWVDFDVAAKQIGRTRRTIELWAKAGMPTRKLGQVRYVRISELTAWAVEHARRTRIDI